MVWLDFQWWGASACVAMSCFFEKSFAYARTRASGVNLYIRGEDKVLALGDRGLCHHDMAVDGLYWSMQNYDSQVD